MTTDGTFRLLLDLVESETGELAPDSRRVIDDRTALDQLAGWRLLYPGPVADAIRCPECCAEQALLSSTRDHYYCVDCGRLAISPATCISHRVDVDRVVRLCTMGLLNNDISGIRQHNGGKIWNLGILRLQQVTTTCYFARHLHAPAVVRELRALIERDSALSGHLIVTSTLPETHFTNGLEGLTWKYLPDVATLGNANITFDWNRIPALRQLAPSETSPPTTLRYLRTRGVVLVNGEEFRLSPQEKRILLLLIDARDQEATTEQLKAAAESEANDFRVARVFRHHRAVFEQFLRWKDSGEVYELLRPDCDVGLSL